MAKRILLGLLALGGAAGMSSAYWRFRREIAERIAALEAGSTVVQTALGPIEYARLGHGVPLLLIHGAGGGYDQGVMIAREWFATGYDIVAPSRFGYLRTPLPEERSPALQADVHAALLDTLKLRSVVVAGVSAGAPSAIELALRHPERVKGLILLVPQAYDPRHSVGVDRSPWSRTTLRLIESSSEVLYWLAIRLMRSKLIRFLGVDPALEAKAAPAERRRVTALLHGMLPLSRRVRGIAADSAVELEPWPLERIVAPTLIITAQDDLFRTLPGARFTAERISGAEFHVLAQGGHLLLGHGRRVRRLIADFVARLGAKRTPR